MSPIARVVQALLAAALVGLLAYALFGHEQARAQVDPPITTMPQTWTGMVADVAATNPLRACVSGWKLPEDRYRDYQLQAAFIDCGRLTSAQCLAAVTAGAAGDMAGMAALRTGSVAGDPAMAPCMAKLQAPPLRWIVAPIASGQRPAYLLNADATRGAQQGTAAVAIVADSGASSPMWCDCRVRSVETTSSTYCAWATGPGPDEPKRVTLCRLQK